MSLKIAQLGQPVLRRVADEVPLGDVSTPAFRAFLGQMRETLTASGGVGLAAPQVFDSRRVFLAAIHPPTELDGPRGVEVFINPRIVAASTEQAAAWEGCLSFPELTVLVARYRGVRVEYVDAEGRPKQIDLTDFPARVVQHEYDHLNGILTIDRAVSTRHIIKTSEMDAVVDDETP